MSTFQRFEIVGTTPHRHELEGIEWLRAALPTYGAYGGYALFSFQTDDGRRYEVDAIALTANCLYVIELKSWQGRVIGGDVRHLVTQSSARGREVVDHPLPLLETKTKSLKSKLLRVARGCGAAVAAEIERVWAEPLVWLTHADKTDLGDHDAALSHVVVGRDRIGDALRQASFPGVRDDLRSRSCSPDTLKALRRVLHDKAFGLGKIDKPLTVLDGRFDLTELVEEGDDYQDHWAVPHGVGPRCRVRSYLVPKSDRAFSAKLDRRASREADVLVRLGDHQNIVAFEQLDLKGPLGPALVFRGFAGKTLEAFVKEQRLDGGRAGLGIDDKLTILRRVADALTFCHRNDVVHGALSPEAVLVHRMPAKKPGERSQLEVKLSRFALAAAGDPTSEGTRLFTRLAGATASLYEAPEVARGEAATPASDLFSLGALAYYLLAEEPPAASAIDLAQRLARDDGLRISAVRDDLFPAGARRNLDEVLFAATSVDPAMRTRELSTPLDLVELLEEALTAPEVAPPPGDAPVAAELDPLKAGKGKILDGDLEVLGELGSGATSRVFKVRRADGDELALKVPLNDTHDERLVREGEVLARLRQKAGVDRIAHLVDKRTIDGRTCLLVQFAGDQTLADELRAEGALSLDYARRWGTDLLMALRSLEEAGVQHRDIKPANIGLTSGSEKGKKRLLLFDFSLSHRPASEVGIGTPAYKDPELAARGSWDDAADRWAAAITLHEMFTGVRPAPVIGAGHPIAVRLDADRLDADVRDGLLHFFERAFRSSAAERFPTADDMLEAFHAALHKVPEHEPRGDGHDITAAELAGLGPEARVGELPLSTRQRNALDRMGIYALHELAQLSSNRLRGVRGVGAKTARSLVDLAALVRKHLEGSVPEAAAPPAPLFFRGFEGAAQSVADEADAGHLSQPLARRLVDAGLVDTLALASAPQSQVKNLVARARKDGATETAKDLLAWLERFVDEKRIPGTLGAAAELLAPATSGKGAPSRQRLRQYLGFEDREGFPRHGTMRELAGVAGVTAAAISIDLGKARDRWTGLPLDPAAAPAKPRELAVLERVYGAVSSALGAGAGVLPLARAAAAVLEVLPPEPELAPDAVRRASEALVRAVCELDARLLGGPEDARLRFRRSRTTVGEVLIAWDRAGFDLADDLGRQADALVEGSSVAAETGAATRLRAGLRAGDEVDARLAEQACALADRALVALAVTTAERARLSARGELYPVGLPADRAILLSAAALAGELSREELQRRVRARYPESGPFPEDPATLEGLAEKLGLRFEPAKDTFYPRERTLGSGSTEIWSNRTTATPAPAAPAEQPSNARPPRPLPLPLPRERAEGDVPGATAARIFDEELDRTRRESSFRVLLWRGAVAGEGRVVERGAPNADLCAETIARRTGGTAMALDRLLIEAAESVALEKKLPKGLEPALAADGQGPDGKTWPRLVDLMRLAAERMVDTLLATPGVRVLTRLGLLGRYDLLSAIGALAAAHRVPAPAGGRHATLVVLPVYAGEGALVEVGADVAPRVGAAPGTFLVPVPGLLRHEIITVPAPWVVRHGGEKRRSSTPTFQAVRP